MTEKKTPGYLQGIEVHELCYGQSATQKIEGSDREWATMFCQLRGKLADGQDVRIATLGDTAVDLIMQLRRVLPDDMKLPGVSRLTPGRQTKHDLGDRKLYIDVAGLSQRKAKQSGETIVVFERFRPSKAPDIGYDDAKAAYLTKEKEAYSGRAMEHERKIQAEFSDRDVEAMMDSVEGKPAEAPKDAPKETETKVDAAPVTVEQGQDTKAPEQDAKADQQEAQAADQQAPEQATETTEDESKAEAPVEDAQSETPTDDKIEASGEDAGDKVIGNEDETDADYTETTLGLNEENLDEEPQQDEKAQASTPAAGGLRRGRRVATGSAAARPAAASDAPKADAPAEPAKSEEKPSSTPAARPAAGGLRRGVSRSATPAQDKPAEQAAQQRPAEEKPAEQKPATTPSTSSGGGLRRRRVVGTRAPSSSGPTP